MSSSKEVFRIAEELQKLAAKYFYSVLTYVQHSGHYYHEMCTRIYQSDYEDRPMSDDDLEVMKDLLRDYMRWIYKRLEEADEYRSSKEKFLEEIADLDIYFNEDGGEMFEGVMDKELEDYVEEDETE